METDSTATAPPSHPLTREDLQRAFTYLRGRDLEVVKIEANPSLEDFLFEAGVGVPLEYVDTELGLKFIGRSASDPDEVEELRLRMSDPFHADAIQNIVYGAPDLTAVRVWRWDEAPPCLRQFAEQQGEGNAEWVVLVPPTLFGVHVGWLQAMTVEDDPDFYMLPGGWQVFITTVS